MKRATNHLKKADPVLAAIIERVGPYKIKYSEPTFQTLVRSIVYQQLNGKAALTIFNPPGRGSQGRPAHAGVDSAATPGAHAGAGAFQAEADVHP